MKHPITCTHVLLDSEDLALLKHHLGRNHHITARVRDALRDLTDKELAKYRQVAMHQARDGQLEIDLNATVSRGSDPGAYVMAWLWIDDDELAP